MEFDWIIVGAGMTGATAARCLADAGKKVLILESRAQIGGNAFDRKDDAGVLIHQYGPHIFHTKNEEVYTFLSRFTEWRAYRHKVLADLDGEYLPVPFNLNSLVIAFGFRKAASLKKKLIDTYGEGNNVGILTLRESDDPILREVAEYVYKNVFETYTVKQWGMKPEEIDPAVTARVPVRISTDNGYFTDPYQGMPADGYTAMFEKMLSHENITVCLNTDAKTRLTLTCGNILFDGAPFAGKVLYTGALDALFDHKFGYLPYRSLDFRFETLNKEYAQLCGTVNYTVSEEYTRITEFKHLTGQKIPVTTVMKEYSKPCTETDIPYYPIENPASAELYAKYRAEAETYPNLLLCGRLAEFRYYNMDAAAASAMELCKKLI